MTTEMRGELEIAKDLIVEPEEVEKLPFWFNK
jgi:hypothetical protein